jgi:hypothetical protein
MTEEPDMLFEDRDVDTDPQGLYASLNVTADASADQLRAGFRRAVKQWHPDLCQHPNADAHVRFVYAAVEVLLDEHARGRYDQLAQRGAYERRVAQERRAQARAHRVQTATASPAPPFVALRPRPAETTGCRPTASPTASATASTGNDESAEVWSGSFTLMCWVGTAAMLFGFSTVSAPGTGHSMMSTPSTVFWALPVGSAIVLAVVSRGYRRGSSLIRGLAAISVSPGLVFAAFFIFALVIVALVFVAFAALSDSD